MHSLKQEEKVGSTTNTLRELIKTGALGINPDTTVTLSYEYSEDVAHYNDDYQDGVFSSSGIAYMLTEFLTTGVDANMLGGKVQDAINESEYVEREGYFVDSDGDEYDFTEAIAKLELTSEDSDDFDEDSVWAEVCSSMTFVPDDISEAVMYDYYEFGVDTSLEQYDYKRGCFTISLELETTAAALLETTYDFGEFTVELDTDVATLKLK